MSGEQSKGDSYGPPGLQKIYEATGGRGQPIFTRERYNDIREQYHALLDKGEATITDLWGGTFKVRLRKNESDPDYRLLSFEHCDGTSATMKLMDKYDDKNNHIEDRIYIGVNGIKNLANQKHMEKGKMKGKLPEHVIEEEARKVFTMQNRCPFMFRILWYQDPGTLCTPEKVEACIPRYTAAWEGSQSKDDLVQALRQHAKNTRPINKVICFGHGFLLPLVYPLIDNGYILHLAACTIAKTLGEEQAEDPASPNKIEIFSQQLLYLDSCDKVLLAKLTPPIQILDWRTNEALAKVDRNTLIFSIRVTEPFFEPALEMIGPDGPAGVLGGELTFNIEEEWDGTKDDTELTSEHAHASASENMWRYKQSCIRVDSVTDEEWFGEPEKEVFVEKMQYAWTLDERGLRDQVKRSKRTGDPIRDPEGPQHNVQKSDKHGDLVFETLDTQLLLAKK